MAQPDYRTLYMRKATQSARRRRGQQQQQQQQQQQPKGQTMGPTKMKSNMMDNDSASTNPPTNFPFKAMDSNGDITSSSQQPSATKSSNPFNPGNGGSNSGSSGSPGNSSNGGSGPSSNGSSNGNSNGSSQNTKNGNTDSDGDSDDDDDDDGDDDSKPNNGKTNNDTSVNTDPGCETVNENDGRLQYTGNWTLESKDPNGLYFTSHTTTTAGSQVAITFNGTSVTVIGVVHASNITDPPSQAAASYAIDTDTPIQLPLPFTDRDIPNQQFFESADLPLGSHRLVINVTSNGSQYTLSSLKLCTTVTNSVAAAIPPSSRPTSRISDAAIVGGVLGGVAFLFSVILGFILVHRRNRKARGTRTAHSPILSWLQRRTVFTSSDSIMRNNPSNVSSVDPFDKNPAAENLKHAESIRDSASIYSLDKNLPLPPVIPPTPLSQIAVLREPARPESSFSNFSYAPALTLPPVSDHALPASADPEGHLSLPPHPPLSVMQRPQPF
ncbi:hypothetical protein PHLCEN_2v3955 [Hermanssonia centrifuga]|uniref:Uncharacterized protein n=1 Tax=Hermanssonia centrifuga TaxID=98765 RepID=A0A2R6Q7K4_9APHY|nr:hypothetical protein PHLCEN_2v3955 [Hermanssonia centrifuga]